jgi:heptosyltransferase-3
MVTERGNPRLRFLDRYAGVPLVVLLGAVRRRRRLPDSIRRVGILNSTNVGDTVLISPVIRDVAAALASSEVVVFTSPSTAPLVRLIEGVHVVVLRLSSPAQALPAIRRERLDAVLDFDPWPRIEALYSALSGARFTAGFRTSGQYRHYAYDTSVEHSTEIHQLDNYRRVARALGVESTSTPAFAPPGAISRDELPQEPYVVFHLWPSGFRSALKEWPFQRWHALAGTLAGRGYRIVLTGGPADVARTKEFAESAPELRGTMEDVAGKYDLSAVLDVLAGSSCVVSVNTGLMHMAAAVGVPTVALNGPTSERRWGPIGERVVSVNSSFTGCGYLDLGWEYEGRRTDCMDGIEVERVIDAVEGVIRDR